MFDLDRIATITGGTVSGKKGACPISGISTDSRSMEPGALFIPLRGERFDGHDYLSQAVTNGAAACLSEEVIAGLSVPVVRVANTLKALGDIASVWRQQLRGPLVGITGSAGKTTTKEMLASIYEKTGPGLKTAGNFNNLIGLPLTLLRMTPHDQWAVVEMGTSALGEIERLTQIAQPTIGIITNVGPAHLETLQGLDGVARAKGELFAGLQGGAAVINLDDERVARLPVANGVKKITYGLNQKAQVRAQNVISADDSTQFELCINDDIVAVTLPIPGVHNVHNALAAAAAAFESEVPVLQIKAGLESFKAAQGRMDLNPLPCGGILLDDSYNSNPLSARAALDALANFRGRGRRIAVLGDMLELGSDSASLHEQLGAASAPIVDLLIAVGSFADDLKRGATNAGLNPKQVVVKADADTAAAFLKEEQRSGDMILVKGSRGIRLDKVVAALKAPANDTFLDSQKGE